jgi:hypothetical protein
MVKVYLKIYICLIIWYGGSNKDMIIVPTLIRNKDTEAYGKLARLHMLELTIISSKKLTSLIFYRLISMLRSKKKPSKDISS